MARAEACAACLLQGSSKLLAKREEAVLTSRMALLTADPPPPAAAAAAAAGEQWVKEACRVLLDAEGNVVSHIPQLLACAVVRLVEAAEAEDAADGPYGGCHQELTRLHGCRPPGIAIDAYAARLLRYCKCSPVCYVAGAQSGPPECWRLSGWSQVAWRQTLRASGRHLNAPSHIPACLPACLNLSFPPCCSICVHDAPANRWRH